VVTGRLEGFTRREIKEYIQDRGGRVTGSVSGSTDYLVVGENPGSKLAQAREREVPVLAEQELRELVKGAGPSE
jgi:DNA ligase (NAD+)